MALQEEFEQQGNWLFRYRSNLPLIILVLVSILYFSTKVYPETFILENSIYEFHYEMICLLVSLLGLGIRIYTVGYTPENTSGRNVTGQVADTLNTTAIYSLVRHPLYVGNLFMWLGPVLLTGNFWFVIAFLLMYWLYYERIMFAEEQFLRKEFGDGYLDWAKNVPAFVPNFKNFKASTLSFSWKKVLKKEKNGLAATFIIFFLFEYIGEFIQDSTDYNYVFIVGCIVSVIAYVILKYLKSRTGVLDEKGR